MFHKLKIGTKLLLVTVLITLLIILVNGITSSSNIKSNVKKEAFNKLTAVREMKTQQIEDYFQLIINQVITFSENKMIINAMEDFSNSFNQVSNGLREIKDIIHQDKSLGLYYENEFISKLNSNLSTPVTAESFIPTSDAVKLLQYLYIANNENATGDKHRLNSAADGSHYSATHQKYHPVIRSYLEKFKYYDIFLVDAQSGNIVYSVFKEIDFGTNLLTGPFKSSNIATAFRAAKQADNQDFIKIVDFESYPPSYSAPASFIASPIFKGDKKIGVLIFQMPVDSINDIMTNQQSWKDVGLGDSGETYIVGDDLTLRNQSRFLIESKSDYLSSILSLGADKNTATKIDNLNSSVGLQKVETQGTQAALSGKSGTAVFNDYRGKSVLSAYSPLNIPGLKWVIMSEIDEGEAFTSFSKLRDQVILLSSVLLALAIYVSYFLSISLTKPLRRLQISADALASGDLETEIKRVSNDEIGDLSVNFENMRLSLKQTFQQVEVKNLELETRVADRTKELNDILEEQEKKNDQLNHQNLELEHIQEDLLKSRKAVENSEQRVSTIIQSSPDAIMTIDKKGTILTFNLSAENIFGYRAKDILGKNIKILMPKTIALEHDLYLEKYIPNSESTIVGKTNELVGQRQNGSQFPLELKVELVFIDDEVMFIGLLRDITEQKKLQLVVQNALDTAEQASQAKSGFLANMSHELRTPMNAIIGYSEMLAEDAEDDGLVDMLEDLNKITSAGKHLLSLINDVLDISKIEAGKMDLYLEDFDLGIAVKDVATTSQSLIDKNKNTLTTSVENTITMVHGDLTKIKQILFNLVSNAAKFTSDGQIKIIVEAIKVENISMIKLIVSDTGVGIPTEKLDKIFDEFSQADESTTRNYGGTGLGLALVRQFCELMGGNVHVESILGQGSSFICQIPQNIELKKEPEITSSPHEIKSELNTITNISHDSTLKKVLIIDDDHSARELLQRNLEGEGYDVLCASNGKDGLLIAKKWQPSLITCDIMMPVMDGWDVLKELKNNKDTEQIPVVMVSMMGNESIGLSLGAVDHLSKPVDRDLLKKVVLKYALRGKALVVEDDEAAREIALKSLSSIGWQTASAENGQEGLDVFKGDDFDLILLDIMMPVMDGFGFIKGLRATKKGRNVPVIVLTAKDLSPEEKALLDGTVEQVFLKGESSIEDLLTQIKNIN